MSNTKIGIVGAGIQGVCNALFLQKKNYEVHLFDREEPGSAASYGMLVIFHHTRLYHLIDQTY